MRVGLGQGGTTDSLDPQTYTDIYMIGVGFATHSTLTEISPEGELIGDVAESWEGSADAATWTFRLRQGVTFTDGKDLTAEDVMVSIDHHRGEDSKSAAKDVVAPITEMSAPDPLTVVFTLNGPNADFPYLMADYHLLMMPAKDGKANWEDYVGTGAYTLVEHEPGVRSLMKRRDDYWKEGRGHFDEIEQLVILDPAARQNAVASGEVDLINRVDLKTVHLLARRPGIKIQEVTGYLHYTTPMLDQHGAL